MKIDGVPTWSVTLNPMTAEASIAIQGATPEDTFVLQFSEPNYRMLHTLIGNTIGKLDELRAKGKALAGLSAVTAPIAATRDPEPQPTIEVVVDLVMSLPRCEKGLCLAPATRAADIRGYPFGLPCCDKDGGTTVQAYPYAEALRGVVQLLKGWDRIWFDQDALGLPAATKV